MREKPLGSVIRKNGLWVLLQKDENSLIFCRLDKHGSPLDCPIIATDFVTNAPVPAEWEDSGIMYCDPQSSCRVAVQDCPEPEGRLSVAALDKILRARILGSVCGYYEVAHTPKPFVAGASPVPVSGKCWGTEEMKCLVDASLDFWLTTGRYNEIFEHEFAARLGRKHALTVNSGSSANLVALSALCSPKLGDRRLKPGDEVITAAAGFPTTVAPIVQHGLIPVFVDAAPPTYNVIVDQIASAITPKTRAIFLAHTLGNPFDIQKVLEVAHEYKLWIIEDSCDALGSEYNLPGQPPRLCGSFGHISTFSFYPAHHITMGEGGAVTCDDIELYHIALSMRDWGRDCWCAPGHDDSCHHRYKWNFPLLPEGYDHKYVYSHLGYNLKITDMQASVGVAQLKRLDAFTKIRRRNFLRLHDALSSENGEKFILPEATQNANPSWFGFPITLNFRYDRTALLEYLNHKKIATRLLFAGNMTCQPCFQGVPYRIATPLNGTNQIMRNTFWLGIYPGIRDEHIDYIAHELQAWFKV